MKKLIGLVVALLPTLVSAQTNAITDVNSLTVKLVGISNVVIYLLVALAVIFIVWNVVMALIKGEDPAAKKAALGNIGYGLLGLAIIVSIWGLVNILVGTFRTNPTGQPLPNIGTAPATGGVPGLGRPIVD